MLSNRNLLYTWISHPRTGWLLILFATACKSILAASFSSYESDKSFYLLLAQQIADGEGFTIPVSLLNNPGVTENIYLPSAASPLYSLLAAPLLKLFPGNYFMVTWLIETLSWFFLFILLRQTLFMLTRNHFWSSVYILFAGLFLYAVETSSASKDIPALALLFLALYQCIRVNRPGTALRLFELAGISFLFLLPGLMKLTYLPLSLVFPLAWVLAGILKKEKRLQRYGAVTFMLTALLVAGHYFYFHSLEIKTLSLYPEFYSQRWTMAKSGDEYQAGFFPENLLVLYPFVPAAVFNLDFAGVQVKTYLYSVYQLYAIVLYTINFIGVAIFVLSFFYLLKKYNRKPVSDRIFFLLSGLMLSLSLIALLSFMSLRYQAVEYKGSSSSWTFVYESRSFLFPLFFLQLCLFTFLFSQKQTAAVTQWLRTILLVILAAGFIHGSYFLVKRAGSLNRGNDRNPSVNQLVAKATDSLQKSQPGFAVWLATEMPHLEWYAKLQGLRVKNGLHFLNDSSFQLPPKTILLTAVSREDTARISRYLRRPGLKPYRQYDAVYFVYREENP